MSILDFFDSLRSRFRYELFRYRRNRYLKSIHSLDDPWSARLTSPFFKDIIENISRNENYSFRSTLDIGCGQGFLSESLIDISLRYLGLDVCGRAIDKSKKKYSKKENVSFQVNDISTFASCEKFSFILISQLLDYLGADEHFNEFCKTIYRINKLSDCDGGLLIINRVQDREEITRYNLYINVFLQFKYKVDKKEVVEFNGLRFLIVLLRRN
jgi:SAM-dependent methyltransferase